MEKYTTKSTEIITTTTIKRKISIFILNFLFKSIWKTCKYLNKTTDVKLFLVVFVFIFIFISFQFISFWNFTWKFMTVFLIFLLKYRIFFLYDFNFLITLNSFCCFDTQISSLIHGIKILFCFLSQPIDRQTDTQTHCVRMH